MRDEKAPSIQMEVKVQGRRTYRLEKSCGIEKLQLFSALSVYRGGKQSRGAEVIGHQIMKSFLIPVRHCSWKR